MREFFMKYFIRRSMQIITVLVLGVSFNAYADSWNCSRSDLVREVVIEYPEGGAVPCNVVYKKQTEGVEDEVLWSALNEEGYCEEKARELVATLESSGWVCLETVSSDEAADTVTETTEDAEEAVDTVTEKTEDAEEAVDAGTEETVVTE
jgi:hypothetical protein